MPAAEQVARHRVVARRRHRDAGAVDAARRAPGDPPVRRHAERLAHRPRAVLVDVDDRHQLDLRVRGVLLGVEASEVPHADHRRSQASAHFVPPCPVDRDDRDVGRVRQREHLRPVEDDRAARLDRRARGRAPRRWSGSSPGRRPGRSKRRSWVGLQAFTTTMSPFTSWPARRIVASVPSMPSTATTALPRTTTLCPMSNCPMTFATRKPKWMSAHSSGVGGRADEHALRRDDLLQIRASTRRCVMPSLSSSCGERPQQHVVAQRAAPRDDRERARIGLELAEQARLRDAAHHDGARDAGLRERLDDRFELPGVHPGDGLDDAARALRSVSPTCATATTSTPRRRARLGEEHREAAAAGDETDALHHR